MDLERAQSRAEKEIPKVLPSGGRASTTGRWVSGLPVGGAPEGV